MNKRYREEQIIGFLREAESGIKVKDLCRRHRFSEASFYAWRSKFGWPGCGAKACQSAQRFGSLA